MEQCEQKISTMEEKFQRQSNDLGITYKEKRTIYESLLKEIAVLEENLENISFGLYRPHFDYNTSDEFKARLEQAWSRAKALIREGKATHCPVAWQVGGSKAEGVRMIKNNSKLMLRAFNGECDAAVAKVRWNNIGNMEARIERAFAAINNLMKSQQIEITPDYLRVKLEELRLEFELQEKLYQEREEQKRIRAQMREEELALKEIEQAQREAEAEEDRYQKALQRARLEVQTATGEKLDELNGRILELEGNLKVAQEEKERALSRAQLTKSGHVYVISNIGSFGDDIFKIGMTRRLEPLDRVQELGDASVPFSFDVHALIYSENAPELENVFHRKLDHRRLNLVNQRREFFNVTLEEIEAIAAEMGLEVQLTRIAEAKEYRTSQSVRAAKTTTLDNVKVPELDRFPEFL